MCSLGVVLFKNTIFQFSDVKAHACTMRMQLFMYVSVICFSFSIKGKR